MNTFLLACGGTGGHLSPGIALAERLTARGHRCLLVVSRKEIDSRLCHKYGDFEFVRSAGEPFALSPARLARCALGQGRALIDSLSLLRRERPGAVLAFGGFTSVPLVLAASLARVPVVLHEANRRPGKAVRLLARLADRVYLPPGVTIPGLRAAVTGHPGFPLRREIRRLSREAARAALGLPLHGKLLLVLGGSQGASALNDWVRQNLQTLGAEGINVYCITGPGKGTEGVFEFRTPAGGLARAWFVPFSDRMAEVICAADLAVSRAGAGSIAEMVHCRTPSVLVPYPHAADNHQHENARFLERQGGCLLVEQHRLPALLQEVRDLIFHDWLLETFRNNLRQISRLDAADWVARDLERVAWAHSPEAATSAAA